MPRFAMKGVPKRSQVVHNDESDSTEQNEPKVNCSNVETRAKGETSERAIVEDATGSDAEVSSDDDPEGQLVAAKVQRKVQKLVAKEFERMYVAAWEAIPTETDVEEYEQQLEIRRELKQEKKVKQMRKRHIYKYGRYLMIFLGIFGIPVDLWKGYQGVEMHPRALEAASAAEGVRLLLQCGGHARGQHGGRH
ncbi:hypothetical protein HDE_11818 [Halotydeus destructor]|nr:hypothetical protein HDE_11818 [Halotydeus destructor]